MKYWILVLALALLAGCSGPVWETVDDQQPQTPVAVWQEEAFEIRTALPEGAELVEETDGLSLYRVAETGLEIEQRVFLAWDKAAAVRLLTGQEAETLTVLETTRFGLPQAQFAWYDADACRLCRADLILDGMTGYALVCSLPAGQGADLAGAAQPVFGSFGLYTDEAA